MKTLKLIVTITICLLFSIQLNAQDSEYTLDETYQISSEGTVHLNSNDAEVSIKGTDRSDVHLKVYRKVDVSGLEIKSGGKFNIEVEKRDGDLMIRESDTENRTVVGKVTKEYTITIKVPTTVGVDIKGDDDTYNIASVNGRIAVEADDTEIALKNVGGNDFYFDMDDGSITMDKAEGNLKLSMDDGNFEVDQAAFTKVDAQYDDGSVVLTSRLAQDGKYRFDMDDGDLKFKITGGGGTFDIRHDNPSLDIGNSFENIKIEDDRSQFKLPGGNANIRIITDDGTIDLRTM
ncbi:putative adhesin [Fodinibius salinus]|uniref:Putative adhesin n=1 Tax=Fodinibius salinus TaxID=860790 RepID=A0A5D3YMR0_9BACT|nr:DUF4097 family beta strand repeat-containing protein [Fodinibius salinus]TYP93981.1 putative adhesin [Fodinibius salinus]